MLISDSYRLLNRDLHARREDYGCYDSKYRDLCLGMIAHLDGRTFLSYGAGKRTLTKAMSEKLTSMGQRRKIELNDYDPALPKIAADPMPADIVACCDVLEHIEPDCLDDVLAHLASKVLKAAFLTVATRPAVKFLADGRNAHLIQENWLWWAERINAHLPISTAKVLSPGEVHFYCVSKAQMNAPRDGPQKGGMLGPGPKSD